MQDKEYINNTYMNVIGKFQVRPDCIVCLSRTKVLNIAARSCRKLCFLCELIFVSDDVAFCFELTGRLDSLKVKDTIYKVLQTNWQHLV